jgi:quinol monooxygenase YgiN
MGPMTLVILQGVFTVNPDERERFIAGSVEGMRSSRQEKGCLEYVVAADPLDPGRVVLSERWESTEDLQHHLEGQSAQRENAAPSVEARPVPLSLEVTVYEVATSRPLR